MWESHQKGGCQLPIGEVLRLDCIRKGGIYRLTFFFSKGLFYSAIVFCEVRRKEVPVIERHKGDIDGDSRGTGNV
jgi:hypothetical protein